MKGFKPSGKGPSYGNFSFSPKHGFSGSTGRVQLIKPYARRVAKARGGKVGLVKDVFGRLFPDDVSKMSSKEVRRALNPPGKIDPATAPISKVRKELRNSPKMFED